ncbi:sensor histidine kinase [Clostridium sp. Marseille-P2415]|uniref:sensor histidine kinase n=1 Tax=Clostridium sp. Marseille-P2415 TaxID=1805471 RepID=UPI0009886390|nr:HAMP domain-containing sensor histidine kinase [Clostridium sp. Marseille-P2415]
MKSFAKYISKCLISFAAVILALLFINVITFGLTFGTALTKDYGETSPQNLLKETAEACTEDGISEEAAQKLKRNHIWAMFLNQEGRCVWSADVPEVIPDSYTIQDVAVFSKGYLADYPVFIWNTEDGMLVLGYPKDSYTKLTGNYFSIQAMQLLPLYVTGMLVIDCLILFAAYYLSNRKIMKNTEPIISSIKTLSDGKPVSLSISGELSEVADSVNKASRILSRQNEARANWISGVSHDIRTPLSMIMGYADRIMCDEASSNSVKEQAEIVRRQSAKIKDLVQDLNLVSRLEYDMQPINKTRVRLRSLIRSYVAELLNGGISDAYSIELLIAPAAESVIFECDARLITRAIANLVQNSIRHNPKGCDMKLLLDDAVTSFSITVADNGVGLSAEKLRELEEKPHYMESTDERLDLRHGLGLILVRQIVETHDGTMQIESKAQQGYKTVLTFPKTVT